MIRALFSRVIQAPPGGSAEAALSFEGISWGWAFLVLVVLAAAVFWSYHWGAPGLSRLRRSTLAGLRILLIALFLVLIVKPVLLLTLNEPVRERLLVLLDTTQSMGIQDRRVADEDWKRAALGAGLIAPEAGLNAPLPADADKWKSVSRADLLLAIAGNDKLKLWPRLQEKADLFFYGMGRDAHPLGPVSAAADSGAPISTGDSTDFFQHVQYSETGTAIGDSLRQVLDENRGQPVTGILLVTDGANNTGAPPEEAAQTAQQDGLPLYLYGTGITAPRDIVVHDLAGPHGAFVKERAEFSVKVRAPGFTGRTVKLLLKANGKQVDEQEIRLDSEDDTEYRLGFEPQEKGETAMEASIEPIDGEASRDNNAAATKLRVLDSKIKVLYVESEPRWDFRYLLETLQRDRRLSLKCVLLEGDPDLGDDPNSVFLKDLPTDRAELVSNEIIILGDCDPQVLGDARMKLLNEWVGDMGGGIIFLAGPKNDPFRYAGTPLEPLLPVELLPGLAPDQWASGSRTPIPLKLTPAGEYSPLLRLSADAQQNRDLWNGFPGVRWTARVARGRPTAQVFLADSTPERANGDAPMPVLAQQSYGQGIAMYIGFDETFRWRSQAGEKNYVRIWDQIIQSLSLDRQLGASARTQLKVERPEYLAGEKVVISGKIYSDDFLPLTAAAVPGTLTLTSTAVGAAASDLRLLAMPDRPGEYSVEFTPTAPGEYRFSTIMDPKAIVKFDVSAPNLEMGDTAMNAALLQNMARISGGKFLREEDLNDLPNLIASHSATMPTFKRIELYYSAWWMAALIACAACEWLLRRLWQLK